VGRFSFWSAVPLLVDFAVTHNKYIDGLGFSFQGYVLKAKIVIIAVVIIAVILVSSFAALYFTTYNNIVGLNANVESSIGDVQTQLQRRYDLIPNLVSAASAYIKYEGSILENVTRLRSQWMAASQSGNVDDINNATAQMETGISGLVVTFEAYPDLKSSDVVQSLMVSLEGTENRISTARIRYNDAVREFNTAIHVFPANLWTASWGYTTKSYFEAQISATQVPPVVR
jgi:LemA protein